MDDAVKGAEFRASPKVTQGHQQPAREKLNSKDSEKDKSKVVEEQSTTKRVDQTAWERHFACIMENEALFPFHDQSIYQRYLLSSRKSLDATIASERETKRMRERWEGLRQAFHEAFEEVMEEQEFKEDSWEDHDRISTLPFAATFIADIEGVDIKLALLFIKTEGQFPRLHRHVGPLSRKEEASQDFTEHSWRMRRIHWLIINRKQRHTKNDSLDILAEVA